MNEKIGLIDIDGKLPNLALMKISSYYKSQGVPVEFVHRDGKYGKLYASTIFTRSKKECEQLICMYGDKIEIGGSGWDIDKKLPPEIETCKPDYNLYTVEMIYHRINAFSKREQRWKKANQIVNAGIGFTSRGCNRNCPFCIVPQKEGCLRQAQRISDIVNPKSNIITLHDNNSTADPYLLDKLQEIKERGLTVDLNQGCDIRLMTDEIAYAYAQVKHLRSFHYAWDLIPFENAVISGIKILLKYMKPYKHMCYMLVGFNTDFEEDMYRYRKLMEMGVKPYVMVYNNIKDSKLKHFARWVNMRYHTACSFEEFEPWIKEQKKAAIQQLTLEGYSA